MPLRHYNQYKGGGRVTPDKHFYNQPGMVSIPQSLPSGVGFPSNENIDSNTTAPYVGLSSGNFGPGGYRIAGQHTPAKAHRSVRPGQQTVTSGDMSVSRGQKRDARLYSKNNDLAPGTEFESGGIIWSVNEGGGVTAVRQADTTPEPVVNDPTTTTEGVTTTEEVTTTPEPVVTDPTTTTEEGTTTTTTTEEGTTTTEEATTTTEEGTTTTEEATTTTEEGTTTTEEGTTTTEEGTTTTEEATTTTEEGTTTTEEATTTTEEAWSWPSSPFSGQIVFHTGERRWYIYFPWAGWILRDSATTTTTSTTTTSTTTEEATTTTSTTTGTTESGTTSTTTGTTESGTTSTTTGTTESATTESGTTESGTTEGVTTETPWTWPTNPAVNDVVLNPIDGLWYIWDGYQWLKRGESTTSTTTGTTSTTTSTTGEGTTGEGGTTEIEEIVVTGSPPDWSWPSFPQILTGAGVIGGLGGFGGGSSWTDYAKNAFNAYNMLGGGGPGGGGQGGSMLAAGGVSPIGGGGLSPIGGGAPGAMPAGLGSLNTGFGSPDALAEALRDVNRSKIGLQNFPVFANEGGPIADLVSPENDRDTIPAMLTEDENVITRRAVLGLDLMNGGQGDFAKGHEILDNINKQGEDYLSSVLDRPLFNGGYYG